MPIILEGQPLDDLIAHEASTSGATLDDSSHAWLVEMLVSWQRNYQTSEAQLREQLRHWVRYTAQPADMDGVLITVGMWVLAPFKSGGSGGGAHMKRCKVIGITNPEHRGYGYHTRALKLVDRDGKKSPHLYPSNCMVIEAPSEHRSR